MTMNLTFRETTAGDIEDMFSLRARTRQNPISKVDLAAFGITPASTAADMASGKMKGWVCFQDSAIVGFCNGDGTTGEVLVLAVLPNYEGQRIGTRLLSHVVEWLRWRGFGQPWLAASSEPQIRAHGFYRSLGWESSGRSLDNGDEILELAPDRLLSWKSGVIVQRLDSSSQESIARLFGSAFSASDGQREGEDVGRLARELAAAIDDRDIICFGAHDRSALIGSIFFTPLKFQSAIRVYMLAPVAVHTHYQGRGVGQALINHGLRDMQNRSAAFVVTYGDPSFYTRVGFQPLSERVIQAPAKLSMPHGWLGLSLTGEPIPVCPDRPSCHTAFDDPVYW